MRGSALRAWQGKARQHFSGLPTRKIESFKYTDFSRLLPNLSLNMLETVEFLKSEIALDPFIPLFERLNFDACPLAALSLGYANRLEQFVPKDQEKLVWSSKSLDGGNCQASLVLIHVLEYRSIHIHIPANTCKTARMNTSLIMLRLDRGAEVSFHLDAQPSGSIAEVHQLQVWQEEDSSFNGLYANEGESLGRYDFQSFLMGARAKCRVAGFYRLSGTQHVDHHIKMEHWADETESEQFFKGTMEGKSHGVFNGAAIVHSGVNQAKIRQHNFNLLLSAWAEIDTKPELEIYADKVSAVHGAAIGHLDQEALFYLRSRGIQESMARQMLVEGFFEEVREFFGEH